MMRIPETTCAARSGGASRRQLALAAACALALLIPRGASAWEPLDACQPTWDEQPSPYYINAAGYSRIGFDTISAIFDASFDEWSRPCCSDWQATYRGTTNGVAEDASDSRNIFSFSESSWPSELGSATSTLAVTLSRWSVGGRGCQGLEADMVFNAANHTFGTSHSFSTVDLQAVTTHEAGHWLGLSHSRVSGATMWPTYTDEGDRSLHADDEAGVCALYPGSCTCGSDFDCGDNEECVGSVCVEAPCESDLDCASGLACDRGTGDCIVPPCTSDAECPGAQICEAGSCVLDAECPTCVPCEVQADCGGGDWQCAGDGTSAGFCTRICSGPGDCPGNSDCFGIQGQTFSVCLNNDADVVGVCPGDYVCLDDSEPDPCAGVVCGAGEVCSGGRCVSSGSGCTVCDACNSDATCGDGGSCVSFDGVNSVCVLDCASTGVCPNGTDCFIVSDGAGGQSNVCLNADAATAGACPASFECVDAPADLCAGVRCGAGESCDPSTGACVGGGADAGSDIGGADAGPDAGAGGGRGGVCAVCDACNSDSDCGAGTFCREIGDAGRFCTASCEGGDELCPGDSMCFNVNIAGTTEALCINPDAATADVCGGDWVCAAADEPPVNDAGGSPVYYPGGSGSSGGCSASPNPHGASWLLVGLVLGLAARRRR